jgi:predicted nucleic acid-binding protein
MAIVLFDTNILIDHFERHDAATDELLNYADAVISSITWIEVACKFSDEEKAEFNRLLEVVGIKVVHTTDGIMFRAATIRGNSIAHPPKFNLADCIIRATAETQGRVIITRNPADFGGQGPMVHVPYHIVNGVATNVQPPPP